MSKQQKPNCYHCRWRGPIAGSCHSCCLHPAAGFSDNTLELIHRLLGFDKPTEALNIKGNKHGFENGWFDWPVNFDPIWLEHCDGFEEKK